MNGLHSPPERPTGDPTLERLESQLDWYDRRSRRAQHMYKSLKGLQILAASSIPLAIVLKAPSWVAAALGALIVVLEGFLQLNEYQAIWITYRSTAGFLTREKSLYLARAGPYAKATDAHTLLAERLESLIAREHSKWVSLEETMSPVHIDQKELDTTVTRR